MKGPAVGGESRTRRSEAEALIHIGTAIAGCDSSQRILYNNTGKTQGQSDVNIGTCFRGPPIIVIY